MHISNELSGAKVRDLIDESGARNWSKLTSWLPNQWLDKLLSCGPPGLRHFSDMFYFAGITNDNFLVKSMYQVLDEDDDEVEDDE